MPIQLCFLRAFVKKSCRQVRFSSSKYTKMRMRPGLCPGPHWGTYRAPRPLAGFQGAASRQGRKGKGKGREGRRKREGVAFPQFFSTGRLPWQPACIKFTQCVSGQKSAFSPLQEKYALDRKMIDTFLEWGSSALQSLGVA